MEIINWWNSVLFINDLFTPILLSFISAVIFWMFFNFFPEKCRKRNVRRVLNENIYDICLKIFHIIEIPFCPNEHSPSNMQYKLYAGLVSEDDYFVALQNKCLNKSYLIDENSECYVCIGKCLKRLITELDVKIEKLFNFSYYLSSQEIILLENIRKLLAKYDYDDNAVTVIGTKNLYPIVPNMAYMADNFFTIYTMFLHLLDEILKLKHLTRNSYFTKMFILFGKQKYRQAICFINKDKRFLDKTSKKVYIMLALYKLNRKRFLSYAEEVLKNKLDLVSYRTVILELYNNQDFKKILSQYYTEDEQRYFEKVCNSEKEIFDRIWKHNIYLKKIYENKKATIKNKH